MDFQGAVSGFCLPIGGYFGSCLRFSRQIAWLSSFEKRRAIPPNPLPMTQKINLNSFLFSAYPMNHIRESSSRQNISSPVPCQSPPAFKAYPSPRRETRVHRAKGKASKGKRNRAHQTRTQALSIPLSDRILSDPTSGQSNFRTARNADCGTCTLPTCRIRFFPSFCFSNSFRLRVISPP